MNNDSNDAKKIELLKQKYTVNSNLIIARQARKTIRYIEKNIHNFPNEYIVLKNRIIESCYDILKWVYRANIFQDRNDKKEIVISIQMLNFYLEEAYNKKLISKKKFASYTNHLIEIDKMTRSWFKYEESK